MVLLHWIVKLVAALLLAGMLASSSEAFTGGDFEARAQQYANDLKSRHAEAKGRIAEHIKSRNDALQNKDWRTALQSAEAVIGAVLADPSVAKESVAQSWLALADAWAGHAPASDEGLWAAFIATTSKPALSKPEHARALQIVTSILIKQVDAKKADFDYRTKTIAKIEDRLLEANYGEARIAEEQRQGLLPAQVRELADLRRREEHERAILIDRLMTLIGALNNVYSDLSAAGAAGSLEANVKEALSTHVLTVEDIRTDARPDHAIACIEFNLPLRPEAVEFVSVFAVPRTGENPDPPTVPLNDKDATVDGKSLCIHGLEHGRAYHFVAKRGLPSKPGASLIEDYDTRVPKGEHDSYQGGVLIADRPATAGFRSSAFILPRVGGGNIPLMTINLDQVDLDLVRLSDRTLYRQIALGHIGNYLDFQEFADLKTHFSDPYWSGTAKPDKAPNKTVTTEIPIRDLLDERERIIRSLQDRPLDKTYLSESISTGGMQGRFRVEKLSEGTQLSPNAEPGLYAFIAKIPLPTSYDNEWHDPGFLGNEPLHDNAPAATDAGDTYGADEGTRADFGRSHYSCNDQASGRHVGCLVSVQWFVITDVGLSYYQGPDDLYVIARSLSTGKPIRDAKIELVTANNRVLSSAVTDTAGVARFDSTLTNGTEGNRLAAVVAYDGADFSFIDYKRDSFDLSDHGVAGRRPPNKYDVFLFSDRGIYRPEESVNVTVLVRNRAGDASDRIPPLTLRLRTSNAVIAAERRIAPDEWRLGGTLVSLKIPKAAALGAADLVVYLGETKEVLGSSTIQVDHFRPDRARITLDDAADWSVSPPKDRVVSISGNANAQYLYGKAIGEGPLTDAPATNLRGELSLLFRRAASPVAGCYEDFRFDRLEDEFTPSLNRLTLPDRTDENGKMAVKVEARVPPGDYPLEARLALTLFDEAGKVGVQSQTIPIPLDRSWLGVRHKEKLIAGKEGVFALDFDVLALAAGNHARSATVSYRLYRERNAFVWQQETNSWKYQSDVERTLANEGKISTTGGAETTAACMSPNGNVALELPLGRYYLELDDGAGNKVTQRIDAGWSSVDIRTPTPDRLTIHADVAAGTPQTTPVYHPGDTATFLIEAPFDGEVLVAIANDKVHLWDGTASTTDRRATVKIKIDERWAGNSFYALATVFRRNTDGTPERGPSRAVGALSFSVDLKASRLLDLAVETKEGLKPDKPVSVALRSGNITGKGWATVYAVDEGLLSLTGHADPDPFRYYFGQRALGLSVLDNYGRILLGGRSVDDRSGGDRSQRLLLNNYTSDRILDQFAGPVEFVDGVAQVTFAEAFNFQGTIRFMAIAWTSDRVGAASATAVMRERIVSELRMPRSLASGDTAEVTLKLSNVQALGGRYRVSLAPRPPLQINKMSLADGSQPLAQGENSIELELPERGSSSLKLSLSVPPDTTPAVSAVEVKIEGAEPDLAETDAVSRSFDVAVRSVEQPTSEVAFLRIAPGERVTLDQAMLTNLTGGRYADDLLTFQARLGANLQTMVASYAAETRDLKVGTLERLVWEGMAALNGAPSEESSARLRQIVRDVQGLQGREGFYTFYRLANETALNESEEIADRLGKGLPRIEQSTIWRTALALDFLFQARAAGYPIAQDGFDKSLATLREEFKSALRDALGQVFPSYTSDEDKPGPIPTLDEARLRQIEDVEDPQETRPTPGGAAPAPVAREEPQPAEEEVADAQDTNGIDEDIKFAADEDDNAITDDNGPQYMVCREDYLYSLMLLARSDRVDRSDLTNVLKACGSTPFRPFGAAIMAAALRLFGAQPEAKLVLASIDHTWGPTGHSQRLEASNEHFEAMFLAFLALAEAPESVKNDVADAVVLGSGGEAQARRLSAATQVWLMRAFSTINGSGAGAAGAINVAVTGALPVVSKTDTEILSEFVTAQQLSNNAVLLQNDGASPVYLMLTFRGVLKDDAESPSTGFTFTRRIVNKLGEDVATSDKPLEPNEILYVLISGQRDMSAGAINPSDPILVFDGLPSTFEIVDKDVFELARGDSVGVRAALPSEGKIGRVRMVEARDDGLIAVMRPDNSGRFQIGYSARVITPGSFVLPGTQVEDLRRTEISAHSPSQTIAVSGAQ